MLGRKREKSGYSARIIDLDILFYNNLIISEDFLKLPHPRLHERRFTLLPLNEILPDYIHPLLGKPISSLLNECEDTSIVRKL
jgi:2-amino-4-hydroxy-6-hydroxymethyldihydropteridine diphosphokinase